MNPTLTTFLFEVVNFLLLAGVLGWLLFRPVRDALEKRRSDLQQQADDALHDREEAAGLLEETRKRHSELDSELNQRRVEAREAAQREADAIVATAREQAGRDIESARHRAAHVERSQAERLSEVIADSSTQTVRRLLEQINGPDLQQAFVREACREIEAFDGNSLAPVLIESAEELDDAQRQALLTSLGPAGESATFRLVPDLKAGLRVATNRGLVDISASGLSAFAGRTLHRRLSELGDSSTMPGRSVSDEKQAVGSDSEGAGA